MQRTMLTSLASLFATTLISLGTSISAQERLPADVAAVDGTVVLEPTSPWNIDYGEESCRLARLFGSEEEPHVLQIEQISPDLIFALKLAGPRLKIFSGEEELSVGLQHDRPMREGIRMFGVDYPTFGPGIMFNSLSFGRAASETELYPAGMDLAEAEKVDRIIIEGKDEVLALETGNMKAPIEALNLSYSRRCGWAPLGASLTPLLRAAA